MQSPYWQCGQRAHVMVAHKAVSYPRPPSLPRSPGSVQWCKAVRCSCHHCWIQCHPHLRQILARSSPFPSVNQKTSSFFPSCDAVNLESVMQQGWWALKLQLPVPEEQRKNQLTSCCKRYELITHCLFAYCTLLCKKKIIITYQADIFRTWQQNSTAVSGKRSIVQFCNVDFYSSICLRYIEREHKNINPAVVCAKFRFQ